MIKHLIPLFFFSITLLSAQNPPSTKGSASIQVIKTDSPEAHIKIARTNIYDITSWIDKYEFELSESSKTTGVSPGTSRTSNLNLSKSNRSASDNTIHNARKSLKSLAIALDQVEMSTTENRRITLSDLQRVQNELDKALQILHQAILERGDMYTDKAAELKVRHDTVKNSIGNIRA